MKKVLTREDVEYYARDSKHDRYLCLSCKDYLARLGHQQFYIPNTWIMRRAYADQKMKKAEKETGR